MRRSSFIGLGTLCLLIFTLNVFHGSQQPTPITPANRKQPRLVAFYFHTTLRCVTCRRIEQYSRESIEKAFAGELKSGGLEFRPVNVEEPQNRHYIRDFKLYTKSLVIARISDGQVQSYRNLPKVWELVYSPEKFSDYVKSEIQGFMGGKS